MVIAGQTKNAFYIYIPTLFDVVFGKHISLNPVVLGLGCLILVYHGILDYHTMIDHDLIMLKRLPSHHMREACI